jgi:hypothetical protein
MNDSDFLKQVQAAIDFGDQQKIQIMLKRALKRGNEEAIRLLQQAVQKKSKDQLSLGDWVGDQRRKITEERLDKIIGLYLEGVSAKELAIRYGIKKPHIMHLLSDRGVELRSEDDRTKRTKEIIERYGQGESLNQMAKRFGSTEKTILSVLQRHAIVSRSVDVKKQWEKKDLERSSAASRLNQEDLDDVMRAYFPKDQPPVARKQINLRLSDQHQEKLSELHEFWSNKRELKFMHSRASDSQVFSTEATFSRFLLETALDNLYMDLLNQRQIDGLAEWICELRIEQPNLKKYWQKAKSAFVFKSDSLIVLNSTEQKNYDQELDSTAKKLVDEWPKSKASDPRLDMPADVFKKLWPLAVKKSLTMPDKESSEPDEWALRMSKLDEQYGNN